MAYRCESTLEDVRKDIGHVFIDAQNARGKKNACLLAAIAVIDILFLLLAPGSYMVIALFLVGNLAGALWYGHQIRNLPAARIFDRMVNATICLTLAKVVLCALLA